MTLNISRQHIVSTELTLDSKEKVMNSILVQKGKKLKNYKLSQNSNPLTASSTDGETF